MVMENKIIQAPRYTPRPDFGLANDEVMARINSGLVNIDKTIPTKSNYQIIKDNVFTLFNLINFVLALAVLFVGSYRNLMFMGVVICNCVIGIVQEIRSKKTVDKLNLIASSNAKVIRNGKKGKTKIEKIVLDDIIFFESGDQIIADSIILEGTCEANESLLTGEPDSIPKNPGDMLLSGSYIVSGKCTAKVEHIGENNYSSKLLKGSKYIKKTQSEIMTTLNKIIKMLSIAIIPIGTLLFYRQFTTNGNNLTNTVINVAAALTGMIPEGLVLLTSSVFAVGVLRLAKHKVLVQDLYCVETLARVDTLCLDKTGTITQGTFEVKEVVPQNGYSESDAKKALTLLSGALNDNNETFKAIKKVFGSTAPTAVANYTVPFSSEKKWSGASFQKEGTFILGAAEFIFGEEYTKANEKIKEYSKDYRVLALAHCSKDLENGKIPQGTQLMAFVLIKDKIRFNAEKTLNFFHKQGVTIKVISGDSPITVSKIATQVNLKNFDSYVDATTLKSEEDVKKAAIKYTVFGRVTPTQKQQIIKSLKENGHTVAMVGDGVNDVLAMKESDCSVAMASGSDIARKVSHLVLLNSDFASMPRTVAEGRKVINNLQRSASLFLTKTIYSFLLSIIFFIIPAPYPFTPIQMTLLSAVTIGIPSFVLALEPNREKIKGSLFKNILSKALPAALTVICSIMICIGAYSVFDMTQKRYSTLSVAITGIIGLMLIYKISVPLGKLRRTLLWATGIMLFGGMIYFKNLLNLEPPGVLNIFILALIVLFSKIIYDYLCNLKIEKYLKKT